MPAALLIGFKGPQRIDRTHLVLLLSYMLAGALSKLALHSHNEVSGLGFLTFVSVVQLCASFLVQIKEAGSIAGVKETMQNPYLSLYFMPALLYAITICVIIQCVRSKGVDPIIFNIFFLVRSAVLWQCWPRIFGTQITWLQEYGLVGVIAGLVVSQLPEFHTLETNVLISSVIAA